MSKQNEIDRLRNLIVHYESRDIDMGQQIYSLRTELIEAQGLLSEAREKLNRIRPIPPTNLLKRINAFLAREVPR